MPFIHTQAQLVMNLHLRRRFHLFIGRNSFLQGVLDVLVGLQQLHQLLISIIALPFDI